MLLNRKEDMRILASALRDELEHFKKFGVNEDLNTELLEPIRSRLSDTPLRAYFAQKIFIIARDRLGRNKRHYRSHNEKLFTVKVPFVFELVITIQYLHNQILDKKNGVDTLEKASHNLLVANFLKDSLYEYIEAEFPKNLAPALTKTVRNAFKMVDIGQIIEKKYNTYENFQLADLMETYHLSDTIESTIDFSGIKPFTEQLYKDLPRSYWEFTDLYLKRIYLTCAALFTSCTDFICSNLGVAKEDKKQLLQFATAYGMMRQIINDNADFVPSVFGLATLSKTAEDAFSDLKNRNITLPLIYHLSASPKGSIASWLKNGDLSLDNSAEKGFAEVLLSDHSLFKSVQLSRLLATISERHLDGQTTAEQMLADTCQIAWWNKFLAPVVKTKAYKGFKKSAWYRRFKKLLSFPTEESLKTADSTVQKQRTSLPALSFHFSFK